jgi:hypothetical protein
VTIHAKAVSSLSVARTSALSAHTILFLSSEERARGHVLRSTTLHPLAWARAFQHASMGWQACQPGAPEM